MTEAAYNKLFGAMTDAIETEGSILSAVEMWECPPAVQAVKRGEDATPDYWVWLIEQAEDGIELAALDAMAADCALVSVTP